MILRHVAVLSLTTLLTLSARASVLFDSGNDTFAATGSDSDGSNRDGNASTWGSHKSFPGVTGAPVTRGYEIFIVDSGIFPFLQISLDDPTTGLFVAAYMNAYNPVNLAPNYGLDVNYLGDPGLSQPFGSPSFFQIQVPLHTRVILPINEIDPGAGTGRPFNLIVEGFLDASFADVPSRAPLHFLPPESWR